MLHRGVGGRAALEGGTRIPVPGALLRLVAEALPAAEADLLRVERPRRNQPEALREGVVQGPGEVVDHVYALPRLFVSRPLSGLDEGPLSLEEDQLACAEVTGHMPGGIGGHLRGQKLVPGAEAEIDVCHRGLREAEAHDLIPVQPDAVLVRPALVHPGAGEGVLQERGRYAIAPVPLVEFHHEPVDIHMVRQDAVLPGRDVGHEVSFLIRPPAGDPGHVTGRQTRSVSAG